MSRDGTISGGDLHIPELNAVVDCEDGSLIAFFGELFWHGVTSLTRVHKGVRHSIVTYARRQAGHVKNLDNMHKEAAIRSTMLSEEIRPTATQFSFQRKGQ